MTVILSNSTNGKDSLSTTTAPTESWQSLSDIKWSNYHAIYNAAWRMQGEAIIWIVLARERERDAILQSFAPPFPAQLLTRIAPGHFSLCPCVRRYRVSSEHELRISIGTPLLLHIFYVMLVHIRVAILFLRASVFVCLPFTFQRVCASSEPIYYFI